VLETFKKAFEAHKDVTGLIVHSDQGSQYTSHAYHNMLPQIGAQISMSRRGNCYDNASADSAVQIRRFLEISASTFPFVVGHEFEDAR
jgi:transposase InsO family protein